MNVSIFEYIKFNNNNAEIEFVGKKGVINKDTITNNNMIKLLISLVNIEYYIIIL